MAKKNSNLVMTLPEVEKVINLIRGILPDVETMPAKATHNIEHLARFFETHKEQLEKNGK
jgi:hypothetical protein